MKKIDQGGSTSEKKIPTQPTKSRKKLVRPKRRHSYRDIKKLVHFFKSEGISSSDITTEDILRLSHYGVPAKLIQDMIGTRPSTINDIAYILGVNVRTVRTYQKKAVDLSPQQSEQLLKYNRLLSRGKEVFGTDGAFDRWLRKPAYGLDNEVPLNYLITSEGINLVSDEIERIANGEFA